MKRTFVLAITLSAGLLLGAGSAQARGGALDPTFGTDGRVFDRVFQGVDAMALQSGGKSAIVGSCCFGRDSSEGFMAAAYEPDGSADFHVWSGIVGYDPSHGTAVAWQPDGKLLVAGVSGAGHGFVARVNADGQSDPSFGTSGVETSGLTDAEPKALIVQSSGKIVVVGTANAFGPFDADPSATPEFLLARFNPDGSPDPTFGTNGIVTTSFGGSDFVNAAVQQPDGRIVVGGFRGFVTEGGGSSDNAVLAGYDADGSRDPNFGFVGEYYSDPSLIRSLIVQPDGKIVAGVVNSANEGYLERYNADGTGTRPSTPIRPRQRRLPSNPTARSWQPEVSSPVTTATVFPISPSAGPRRRRRHPP